VIRILILVEGQTEERFVKDVLEPHLLPLDICPIPKIVTTKRVKIGPDFKGGIYEYQKVENDLLRLLGDSDVLAVTTLIDYYALPDDFPGKTTLPNRHAVEKVKHLETEWERKIGNRKFHAFFMTHEF